MSPPTVNAYYSPLMNDINFPAGILQPPFFDNAIDDAVNYGGIGAVIGHELTHGFDDSGRKFDAMGNMSDWWTETDGKSFEERAQCVADQYSSYTAVDEVKLNGKLTLGRTRATTAACASRTWRSCRRSRASRPPRSTASAPTSACSSAGRRSGARTRRQRSRACSRRRTRTRLGATA
jgi:endothelin-converting enzyme/putative endopeptidase